MKRYGRLDENLQGTLQKNRVFCAVMPIHDQRISRRTETRRLFELTKLKKAPSFVIVGLFSADHYLVPCLSLLSSECVVFTDVPRDFQRLAEYFSDGWRREGVIDSSCLFKIGAEVRTVRWKISNNTHPVPVLNNTHPFPSKCSVDALCRVRESVRFASERSRVRIPPGPPSKKAVKSLISRLFCVFGRFQFLPEKCRTVAFAPRIIRIHLTRRKSENSGENRRFSEKRFLRANNAILGETEPFASKRIHQNDSHSLCKNR